MPLFGLTVYVKDARRRSPPLSSMHGKSQGVQKQSGVSIQEQGVAKPPETFISACGNPCKERNPCAMSAVFAGVFCRRAASSMPCPHVT